LSVRRIDRGDMVPSPLGERPDVLMIDEADCMGDVALQALLPSGSKRVATTVVFMCLPSSVLRFSGTGNAVIVQLQAMSIADARNYLLDRSISAGRLNLFAPDASDLAINGSNGSPRALRSIAERAFVAAALEGASEIAIKHVAHALAFHVASGEGGLAVE